MNRTILIISSLMILLSCQEKQKCSYIQDYYQKVYEAELAFYEGRHERVYELMNEVENKCEILNQSGIYEMLKYATSSAIINKNAKSLELINELIVKHGYTLSPFRDNEAFSQVISTNEWKQIEQNYDSMRENYLNSIDLNLRENVKIMITNDQRERNKLREAGINKDSLWQIINKTDSLNSELLKKIFETSGYPNHQIIGVYNVDNEHVNPRILLFHFDDYEYYTNKLLDFIDSGKAPPDILGTFVDSYQRRVEDERKFIFGIYDNVTEHEIIDYKNLDKRRISIGMKSKSLKDKIDVKKSEYFESN